MVGVRRWNRCNRSSYFEAQVHLIDLPGFGSSTLPDGGWDTNQYADRILRYMDEQLRAS